jgi:hypothetical protein
MAGAWKPGKTNSRFSPVSPAPWESGKLRRIPTFPQRRLLLPLFKPKRQKQERNRPLRGLRFQIIFRITLYWKRYLISGSSDDWKMLLLSENALLGHVFALIQGVGQSSDTRGVVSHDGTRWPRTRCE